MGKLAAVELQEMLRCIKPNPKVLVPPQIGFDSGVHRLDDLIVAVAADPCTGVPEEWFGWLLINYAASDLALSGAKPEFCTITLMGPSPTESIRFQKVMAQTCEAADELDIAIVRGHTGMYDSLNDLVGVCTVYGSVPQGRLITAGGAQAGDLVFCTKPLGLEIVTNYAFSHQKTAIKLFGEQKTAQYLGLVSMQSCVKEALALAQIEGVHAMHDATEGGLVSALNELAAASGVGVVVEWEKIPVPKEAATLQHHFHLSDVQLLSMSSTGTILGAVKPQAKTAVTQTLEKLGLTASFIGEFKKEKQNLLIISGAKETFPSTADDPYTAIMATS